MFKIKLRTGFLLLVCLLFTFFSTEFLSSEMETPISEKIDIFVPDTLNNQIENLISSDSLNILTEEEIIDSSGINTILLKENVKRTILENKQSKKKMILPFLCYQEYFHLKSPFEKQFLFRKNGFSIIPFKVSTIHEFQNYVPYYHIHNLESQIFFYQKDYDLPVSLTNSYLALGDYDMDHAFASFQKGKILNIENLNLKFDILTFDGLWFSENEKSKNIDLHLFYALDWGKLHFYHTMIDQEISNKKLTEFEEETSVVNEYSTDFSFLLENPLIDVGYLHDNRKIQNEKRKQSQFLLKKYLEYKTHSLTGYFEYFVQNEPADSTFFIGNLFHKSEILDFKIGNSCYYQNNDCFLFSSEISRNFYKSLGLIGKYSKKKLDIFLEKKGIGFTINPFFMENEIIVGEQRFSETKKLFAEITNFFEIDFSDFTLNFKKWTLFQEANEILQNYPELQSKTYLEFIYNLKHNNALKLGISHFYCSDFLAEDIIKSSSNLDAYFGIQITDRFEIKLDAINLTNSNELFGNSIPGIHFNIGVNWIFVN